jgi:predicted AlkP superfamily phosphohydrolase/phosphomutase
VVLGIDGLEFAQIERLSAAGRLPHLKRLIQTGVAGRMQTILPTWSPLIWTTFATGMGASRHGILDFTEIHLPLFNGTVQRLRKQPLVARGFGLPELFHHLTRWNLLSELPIRATQRREKAFWNILSEQGRDVALVNWYATWPCETVRGFLVSDNNPARHAFFARKHGAAHSVDSAVTYPPELMAELSIAVTEAPELAVPKSGPDAVDLWFFDDLPEFKKQDYRRRKDKSQIFQVLYEADRFAATAALHLLRTQDLDLLAVYLSGLDSFSHRAWRERSVIDRYYEYTDRIVGQFAAEIDARTTLVILSDHGWAYGENRLAEHFHAPDGVILLGGNGIRQGPLNPVTLVDVAPTLLMLLGVGPSEEMEGEPLRRALTPAARKASRLRTVPSYGAPSPEWVGYQDSSELTEGAEESIDRLRQLGYVE